MKVLYFLLQKEFKQIFRNPNILRMIIVIPLIQLLILPLAADFEIKNISIAIVDEDHSPYSQRLVSQITGSGYFKLAGYWSTSPNALEQFETDEADIILEIPRDFERKLTSENVQPLFIAVNAINGVKASMGASYLLRIIKSYNAIIQTETRPIQDLKNNAQVNAITINWFNIFLNYHFYMVPGILVILVTMVGSYMCALNIVKEKEVGTIEQINVSPVKKYQFILGKLIPFWVIGFLIFSVGFFLIAGPIYGIFSAGSLLALYTYLGLYLIAMLGFGLMVSTYSDTQQQAMSLAYFFMMVFILMSGLFTTLDSMPEWAKWIARINPVTYFIEVVRMVVLKGSSLSDLKMHFLIMAGFAILFNTWAILNYKKQN